MGLPTLVGFISLGVIISIDTFVHMLMQIKFRKTECISFIAKDVSRQAKGQQDNYRTELTGSTGSL